MLDYKIIKAQALKEKAAQRREVDALRKAHIEQQKSGITRQQTSFTPPPKLIQGFQGSGQTIGRNPSPQPKPQQQKPRAVKITETAPVPEPIKPWDGKVPENWQDLPWPELRDLAQSIAGEKTLRSRAEARALVAAHAEKS